MALQNGHIKRICSGLKSKDNVAAIGRGIYIKQIPYFIVLSHKSHGKSHKYP